MTLVTQNSVKLECVITENSSGYLWTLPVVPLGSMEYSLGVSDIEDWLSLKQDQIYYFNSLLYLPVGWVYHHSYIIHGVWLSNQ